MMSLGAHRLHICEATSACESEKLAHSSVLHRGAKPKVSTPVAMTEPQATNFTKTCCLPYSPSCPVVVFFQFQTGQAFSGTSRCSSFYLRKQTQQHPHTKPCVLSQGFQCGTLSGSAAMAKPVSPQKLRGQSGTPPPPTPLLKTMTREPNCKQLRALKTSHCGNF